MYSFDASSMIHAWDNYPPANPHFESLWEWIADNINDRQFSISKKAFEEVNHKIPAVCNMQEVQVECINFLELLK